LIAEAAGRYIPPNNKADPKQRQNQSWEEFVHRRNFVAGSAAAAASLTLGPAFGPAFAEDAYPSHAITIINPFPPGGASDVVTRPLAAVLEPIVKQPMVIETKSGAAGAVGAQVAASAKPDGYTLLSHITSISGFAEVDKLFGRPVKFTRADFIPIARFVADPCVLIVNDQQSYKTLKDLTDDAKKRPDEIIFSSSGLYGALHIPMALYMKAAGGLKYRHLPTNGGGPALTAFLGNNAQVLASSVSACLAQIKAGKAKALAVFGANRIKALPEVPTMKELGYNLEYYLWVGMFAPKGTPEPVITYLRKVIKQAAATDQFKAAMANLGQDVDYLDMPEFAKFWDVDAARIEDAVREIGRVQG
jgi:tripartite-type tricarboxylate transporter receptor subunit TctC